MGLIHSGIKNYRACGVLNSAEDSDYFSISLQRKKKGFFNYLSKNVKKYNLATPLQL